VKRLHLLCGVLGLAIFLATGQYMDRWLNHLDGMPDGPRALYRSGHIYILFSASLNLLLGVYVAASPGRTSRILQYVGPHFSWAAWRVSCTDSPWRHRWL
jgi:hypothetical protein